MRAIRHAMYAIALSTVCAVSTAHAQLLNTGIGTSVTSRGASSGPAQRVSAASNTDIGTFGFWLSTVGAVNMKYMIWDEAGTTKLFEQTKSVNSASLQLVLADPFAFTMLAGQTYHFAIIGDGDYGVSYFSPTLSLTQNGLSIVNNNTNFGPYSAPVYQGEAAATIALAINGSSTTVPEPGTYLLMASGLAVLGLSVRHRRAS